MGGGGGGRLRPHTLHVDAFYGKLQQMSNLIGFVHSENGLYEQSLIPDTTTTHHSISET